MTDGVQRVVGVIEIYILPQPYEWDWPSLWQGSFMLSVMVGGLAEQKDDALHETDHRSQNYQKGTQ
jgi:hypothetical protein